jgi:para-aminobenzoate synthetase component 1
MLGCVAGELREDRPQALPAGRTPRRRGASLELFDPDDAFRRLDAFLDDAGFWGDDELVAELYLGYGLAQALRRGGAAPPPEPCALPVLVCRVGTRRGQRRSDRSRFDVGDWAPSWRDDAYAAAVGEVRAAIARGDVYQVNLVQHLSAEFAGDAAALARALAPLRPRRPEPLVGDGWAVVCASPELFLRRRGRRVTTMPIKGTRPLGGDGLACDEKDRAEHLMIVDLERNDLARVCEPGSVRWPRLLRERELAGVVHLVSTVEGTLREEVTTGELLEAVFPGGSVTGAPKLAAIDAIAALEPVGRGASMGALGRLEPNGDLELALTIRTFAVSHGRIHLWVGGGIVWDSVAEDEIEESWVKARPLLDALRLPTAVR